MNRKLMNKLNVMINPQQKYVITTPFTLDNWFLNSYKYY
jgi:hypothetical protein